MKGTNTFGGAEPRTHHSTQLEPICKLGGARQKPARCTAYATHHAAIDCATGCAGGQEGSFLALGVSGPGGKAAAYHSSAGWVACGACTTEAMLSCTSKPSPRDWGTARRYAHHHRPPAASPTAPRVATAAATPIAAPSTGLGPFGAPPVALAVALALGGDGDTERRGRGGEGLEEAATCGATRRLNSLDPVPPTHPLRSTDTTPPLTL